jgi:HSP20 family protein
VRDDEEAAMVMRFDPFRELDRLSEQLASGTGRPTRSFPMDAYRRGEEFVVLMDLPGVDPDSIDLTVERNVLTVRAERGLARQEGDELVVSERPHGSFSRQLFLGESLDAESLTANYDDGVLRITIPVAERAKPRRIQVGSSARGPQTIEGTASASRSSGSAGEGAGAATGSPSAGAGGQGDTPPTVP